MGEYADDAVDRILSGGNGFFSRRYEPCEPKESRCKFCGSTDVRWRQQTGQWVLFSLKPGVLHASECTQSRPDADAFDVIEERPEPICKIARETGKVPLDCLFKCQRGDCVMPQHVPRGADPDAFDVVPE